MPLTRRLVAAALVVVALGAGLVVVTSRDTSASGSVRLLQFNMCGNVCKDASADKVNGVVDLLADDRPDAASLNEVCRGQLAAIASSVADRGWAMHPRFIVTQPDECAGGEDYGLALLTRSPVLGTDRVNFAAQDAGNPEHRGLLCVSTRLDERPTHVCTTHIVDSFDDPVGDVRRTQIADAARRAAAYNGPVVLMGDFNAQPSTSPMNALYTRRHGGGGSGRFDEIGQGSPPCRCGLPTHGSRSKFDYIFLSADFRVVDEQLRSSRFSDHRALLGRVTLR